MVFASTQDMPQTTTVIHARVSPTSPTQTLERRPLTQMRLTPRLATLLLRIESEYREMPGLKLTEAQARRLWDLDRDTCNLVLTTLTERRFLTCTPKGTFVRAAD